MVFSLLNRSTDASRRRLAKRLNKRAGRFTLFHNDVVDLHRVQQQFLKKHGKVLREYWDTFVHGNPPVYYHGTHSEFVPSILARGLNPALLPEDWRNHLNHLRNAGITYTESWPSCFHLSRHSKILEWSATPGLPAILFEEMNQSWARRKIPPSQYRAALEDPDCHEAWEFGKIRRKDASYRLLSVKFSSEVLEAMEWPDIVGDFTEYSNFILPIVLKSDPLVFSLYAMDNGYLDDYFVFRAERAIFHLAAQDASRLGKSQSLDQSDLRVYRNIPPEAIADCGELNEPSKLLSVTGMIKELDIVSNEMVLIGPDEQEISFCFLEDVVKSGFRPREGQRIHISRASRGRSGDRYYIMDWTEVENSPE